MGLKNYADVLSDGDFWAAMWHSTLFTLLTTPLLVLLPLLFAMLAVADLARAVVLQAGLLRALRRSLVDRGADLRVHVHPGDRADHQGLQRSLGLHAPNFLGSTHGAWFAVVLLTTWWTFGFNFILYLAALQDIPEELYEASEIDGAAPWQQMRWLTLPLVRPTISLVLILQVLASLKVFDQIYLLLQGGPAGATRPAIEYIFDTGFTAYRGGYGAAATMVYFVILIAVAAIWAVLRPRRAAVESRARTEEEL